MKGQLDQLILQNSQTKFVSLLDFRNFRHHSQKFPDTACELLLASYGQYFNSLLLKTKLSLIHLTEELLQIFQTYPNMLLLKICVWHYQKSQNYQRICLVSNYSNSQHIY
jgi:hypothetical protein